jgi:hypothetical protein
MKHLVAFTMLIALAACDSPEAARTRGGGPGADVGNREPVLLMHEGSEPYAKTPDLIPGKSAPIDTASHADRLSRP